MTRKVRDLTIGEVAAECHRHLACDGCPFRGLTCAPFGPNGPDIDAEVDLREPPKKWLYSWCDWGLYRVDEVEYLGPLPADPAYPGEELAAVVSPGINRGKRPAKVPAAHLFATREEADEYGRKNVPSGAFW